MRTFDDYERGIWAGRAEAYQQTMALLCEKGAPALVDAIGITPGTHLLDVGTGPGTVARIALDQGATVSAVDAEPSMIELARSRAPGLDIRQAILPDLPFDDDSFDAAAANFVINHVGDPAGAIRAMRRVVRPGGRVAVTIWAYPRPPLQSLLFDAFTNAGAVMPEVPAIADGLSFAHTEAGLAELLTRAGLAEVDAKLLTWQHEVDPDTWWNGPANGIGTTGFILTSQAPETIEKIHQEYQRLAAPHLTSAGMLSLETAAVLGWGRA